ncbi:endolytic transglycosylase MltG [Desulfovermiculus halophilus]|jgi:UPF0755 protein|uniref:endolytic transglycosylase MltG n=1 Tax=Desulfovermiculus halophilus TaxID=339722 RepID=UPI0006842F82|nr:endolytic transglycosylase MltG [Desulfovermiculus halophilus]
MKIVWKRRAAVVLCTSFIAALLCAVFALQYTFLPVQTPGTTVHIRIQPGQSLAQITDELRANKVIARPKLFRLLAVCSGLSTNIQAGEFEVDTGWSRLHILRTLARGPQVLHTLRIPEGLTWWQTADIVGQSGLTSYDAFNAAIHDQDILKEFNIPADSAEGYLFPETYHLPRPADRDAEPIVRLMLREFSTKVQTLWPESSPDPKRIHDLVILASLVEKETGRPDERRTVAGVFANRLQRGMRLQCDSSIIYGLGQSFDGNLTRSHLRDQGNAYNTYTHAGLPPGPICSPGLASLQAAKNPEQHNYLYFVSKGDGSHHFSRTLTEHNRAVRRYQLR